MALRKSQIIFSLAALVLAAAFLFLSKVPGAYVRGAIEKEFAADFSCKSQHESFRGIYFKNVVLKDKKTGALLLEAESLWIKTGLFARLNFLNLRRKIHFEKAVLHLEKGTGGTWNWLSRERSDPIPEDATHQPYSLVFGEGKISYTDASFEPVFKTDFDFSSAEFSYHPSAVLNGAVRITGSKKLPGVLLLGFTYEPKDDSLTFQLTSPDKKVDANGSVQNFSGDFYPQFSLKFNYKDMMMISKKGVGFAGLGTIQAEGSSKGSHPKSFFRHMTLKGALDVRHGTLLRTNLLSQILGSLKPVASLQLAVKDGQAPDYKGMIRAADTEFGVLQTRLQVSQGLLYLDELRIQHPEYYVEGEGTYDIPNGKIDFRARYVALENLSGWFVKQNQAFKAFQNDASGRLVMPFLYRGLAPDIELDMDWDRVSADVKIKEAKQAAEKQEAKK